MPTRARLCEAMGRFFFSSASCIHTYPFEIFRVIQKSRIFSFDRIVAFGLRMIYPYCTVRLDVIINFFSMISFDCMKPCLIIQDIILRFACRRDEVLSNFFSHFIGIPYYTCGCTSKNFTYISKIHIMRVFYFSPSFCLTLYFNFGG